MFKIKKTELDFVAIGDIVIDCFIKLEEAEILPSGKNDDKTKLCMNFADKIPYESVKVVPAVGNSPNASISSARLGLKTALITNIGKDRHGKECLNSLKKDGVVTDFITTHPNKKTNYHYVLSYKSDRTILVKHTEFDFKLPKINPPKWIYLSSLAENSLPYHQEIIKYIKKYPKVKMAFQPGTFQMELGYEKLKEIYKHSELFFCNKQEAKKILKPLGNDVEDTNIENLLKMIQKLGPKIVVITDGPEGSYAYEGKNIWHMPIYPDIKPPIDRTGAGDAFASTFTVALALNKTIPEALMWGPINSMSVVQYIGAQEGLLTRKKLEYYLSIAPKNYKPTKIL